MADDRGITQDEVPWFCWTDEPWVWDVLEADVEAEGAEAGEAGLEEAVAAALERFPTP